MPQPDFIDFLNHLYDPDDITCPPHMAFSAYMDRCMFGPSGYYQTGRVTFGLCEDFWTYPARMSPLYGTMLAHRALDLWRATRCSERVAETPFHLVEVGGGQGDLLADTVAALVGMSSRDQDAAELVDNCAAIAIDRSPALLIDQADRQSKFPIRYIEAGADQLHRVLPQPFHGLVFANELFDVLAVELVRVDSGGPSRLCVLPWVSGALAGLGDEIASAHIPGELKGFRPLKPGQFDELMRRLQAEPAILEDAAAGVTLRWSGQLQEVGPDTASAVDTYLRQSSDALDVALRQQGEPIWLTFPPTLPPVLHGLSRLISGGAGAFLTVDYGGIARHIFDNRCMQPHLRTFSVVLDPVDSNNPDRPGEEYAHNPFRAPGCEDLTHDVDFTWIAKSLCDRGLELAFYGRQNALEAGLSLWDQPYQNQLVRGRIAEGFDGVDAIQQAHYLLSGFRYGGGFHLLIVSSPGMSGAFSTLGKADPLDQPDTLIPPDLDRARLRTALATALAADGVDAKRAENYIDRIDSALHHTGSVVDDLCDVGLYRYRELVLDVLRGMGA